MKSTLLVSLMLQDAQTEHVNTDMAVCFSVILAAVVGVGYSLALYIGETKDEILRAIRGEKPEGDE